MGYLLLLTRDPHCTAIACDPHAICVLNTSCDKCMKHSFGDTLHELVG